MIIMKIIMPKREIIILPIRLIIINSITNNNSKDSKNQFKYASIWNIDNCLPLIQTNQFDMIQYQLKKHYNNLLSLNISQKEIK